MIKNKFKEYFQNHKIIISIISIVMIIIIIAIILFSLHSCDSNVNNKNGSSVPELNSQIDSSANNVISSDIIDNNSSDSQVTSNDASSENTETTSKQPSPTPNKNPNANTSSKNNENKTYTTKWGKRPHEFEEGPFVKNNGDLYFVYPETGIDKGHPIHDLIEHCDGYNNVWYTYKGKIVGNGSIFYGGALTKSNITQYYNFGVWSKDGYYWDEDGLIPTYTKIPNNGIQYPIALKNPIEWVENQKGPSGSLFLSFFVELIENRHTIFFANDIYDGPGNLSNLILDSSYQSFEGYFKEIKQGNNEYFLENGEGLIPDHLMDINFYKSININTYEDLKKCAKDPLNYNYSNYKLGELKK